MLNQTNMVVTQQYAAMGGNTVTAIPVDVCTDCGGLFVRSGSPLFYGMPHAH